MLSSLLFVFIVSFVGIPTPTQASTAVACTMDAKLCPDGVTYVGRDGNRNCQWQLCPGEKDSCAPYVCKDGTRVNKCTEDGTVINYFAAPCLTHGGEQFFASFSDTPSNHMNVEAITYVKDQGIVSGYPDGTFHPDAPINRAEFTKILTQAVAENSAIQACYNEVEPAHWAFTERMHSEWYAPFVCYAKKFKFVEGYPDGSFRPAANINFVEAAKIISIALKISPSVETTAVWYEGFVRGLAKQNAIPTSITHFDQPITRGEMAEMIYRLKTGNTEKKSQTYEFLSLMEHCRQWLAAGGKNCE